MTVVFDIGSSLVFAGRDSTTAALCDHVRSPSQYCAASRPLCQMSVGVTLGLTRVFFWQMSVVPTLGGPGRGWVIGVDMVCRRICLEEPVRWPAGHRRSAVTLAVTKTLGSGLPVHTREDVSPPVCLHAVSDPRVPRESPEPPDEKAALGAAPGARVDNRLPTREVREVGPVVRVGEDRVVAVVLVMAVRIGREVDVAGVGAGGVDLRMAGVGLRRAGEVLG